MPAKYGPKNGTVLKVLEGLKELRPSLIGVAPDLALIQPANDDEHLDLQPVATC